MKAESQAQATNQAGSPDKGRTGARARAGIVTRYVSVRAGELLQVQAHATLDVELLMRSQLCGTIARKTGRVLEAGYLALEEEPVRIQVRHSPDASEGARPSAQLMIANLPPGTAVSSDTPARAAELTDRQGRLLELFGMFPGVLPQPMGQALGTVLAALDMAAQARSSGVRAGASEHTLTVDKSSADRMDHCQYRLASNEDNLYLATSSDSVTGELRCMLVFFSIRGVRVQSAAVHRHGKPGAPQQVIADPVARYLNGRGVI